MKLFSFFAAASFLLAQQPSRTLPPVPKTEVKRASSRIVVDGKLSDEAWKAAEPVTLLFPWEQRGAKQKTLVRLLWDDEYLYVAYDCEDEDITALFDQRDDPTYRDDAVEIFLNPKPQQSFYYGLEMNARAVLYDYFYAFPQLLLKRYDFTGVQLATDLRGTLNARGDKDSGWSLELAIPWRNFEELGGKIAAASRAPFGQPISIAGTEWSRTAVLASGLTPASTDRIRTIRLASARLSS
jgi:Domain of unknown function (DUF1083).